MAVTRDSVPEAQGPRRILSRLDRALPLLVKVAIPVILVAGLVATLVGQALISEVRNHLLETYELLPRGMARQVELELRRDSTDTEALEDLLRALVAAQPLVTNANLYARDGNEVTFWLGTDPEEAEEEPEAADTAAVLAGREESREVVEEGERVLETVVPVRVGDVVVGGLGVYTSLDALEAAVGETSRHVVSVLLVGVGSSVLLVAAILYLVILRRTRRLSRAADRLAEGDLDVRLPEGEDQPGRDELLRVAHGLNRMVDAVRARTHQQEAVASFGQRALAGAELQELTDEAARVVAEALNVEFAGVIEWVGDAFMLVSGAGWGEGTVGARIPSQSQAGYTFRSGGPVLSEDLESESRFPLHSVLQEHGVRASASVVVPLPDQPYGVLGAYTARRRRFTDDDLNFLSSIASVLGAAIHRRLAREQLALAEAKFRTLVERIPAVSYTAGFGSQGLWEYVAPQLEEVLGYTPKEWIGNPEAWFSAIHPEDRDRVLSDERRSIADDGHLASEYRLRTKDGRWRWLLDDAVVVRDSEGQPLMFQGVLYDITDRKEAEEAIRRAYEREREAVARLRSLDEMKNAFLSAVSHELRTPLAAVLGYAVTLEQDMQISDEERRTMVERLAVNARKLHGLLEDLLDLDRLARGIVEPHLQSVDVGALVRRVAEETDLAERSVEVDAPTVVGELDGAKVERILENLLVNAAKHAPGDSPIRVVVRREGEGVMVSVEDQGPGVPDELKDALFRPFVRGPDSPAHSPGAGIGLSLVARFAELHGGRAWVEDRPGGGSAFRVYLPFSPPRTGLRSAVRDAAHLGH
jgi:PAS domain S-box-containing protein